MKRFTGAGRQAAEEKNWYAALSIALMIPDICSSLEDPGPGKTSKRYPLWCKKWLEPRFTVNIGADETSTVFLSADDIYQARCSVIHSGQSEIDPSKRTELHRFEFFSDGPDMNYVGMGASPFLQLRVGHFCDAVFDAAEEWDASVASDEKIQAAKAKLLVIHPSGTVIEGFKFG